MTPVQLPEVPEPDIEVDGVFGHSDDQLRAYATEAVMAERRRVLALSENWREIAGEPFEPADQLDKALETSFNTAVIKCADDLAAFLSTQPEQNSGR